MAENRAKKSGIGADIEKKLEQVLDFLNVHFFIIEE